MFLSGAIGRVLVEWMLRWVGWLEPSGGEEGGGNEWSWVVDSWLLFGDACNFDKLSYVNVDRENINLSQPIYDGDFGSLLTSNAFYACYCSSKQT